LAEDRPNAVPPPLLASALELCAVLAPLAVSFTLPAPSERTVATAVARSLRAAANVVQGHGHAWQSSAYGTSHRERMNEGLTAGIAAAHAIRALIRSWPMLAVTPAQRDGHVLGARLAQGLAELLQHLIQYDASLGMNGGEYGHAVAVLAARCQSALVALLQPSLARETAREMLRLPELLQASVRALSAQHAVLSAGRTGVAGGHAHHANTATAGGAAARAARTSPGNMLLLLSMALRLVGDTRPPGNDLEALDEALHDVMRCLERLRPLCTADRESHERWLLCCAAAVSLLPADATGSASVAAEFVKHGVSLLQTRDCRTTVALAAMSLCQAACRAAASLRTLLSKGGLLDALRTRWLRNRERKVTAGGLALLLTLTLTPDGRQRVIHANLTNVIIELIGSPEGADAGGGGGGGGGDDGHGGHAKGGKGSNGGRGKGAAGGVGANTRHLALAVLHNLCHTPRAEPTALRLYPVLLREFEAARSRGASHDAKLCLRGCEVLRRLYPKNCRNR
jgi:hypothetical protein